MSLFLIGGNAGVGKTTVCDELKARGYEAYDIDIDGFAKWEHVDTGYIHPKSSVKAADRDSNFLAKHSWNVQRSELEALRDRAINTTVFLTGNMANLASAHDMFDGIVALYVDSETLTQRLLTRTSGGWGKQPHELADTLAKHQALYDTFRELGAEIIDATQPLDQVTEDVLHNTVGKPASE